MIPETSKSHDGSVHLYTTSAAAFPFGWALARRQLAPPRGALWRQRYVDTAPIHHEGTWWIFTTRLGRPAWGYPRYSLLLFSARDLLGDEWLERPHPGNPLSTDSRFARLGGRPFVVGGRVHRWAQDCSHYYGKVWGGYGQGWWWGLMLQPGGVGGACYRRVG